MLYLLVSFFFFLPIANLLPIAPGVDLTVISGLLTILFLPVFLYRKFNSQQEPIKFGRAIKAFILLFSLSLISGFWAYDLSAYGSQIQLFAQSSIMLLIVYICIDSEEKASWLMTGYAIGAAILAIVIVASYLLGAGESASYAHVELGRYSLNGVDPNINALQLNIGIALLLGHIVIFRRMTFNYLLLLPMVAAVLLTGSRTGFICLLALITIYIFYQVSFRQAIIQWALVAICFTAVYSMWDFRNSEIRIDRFEDMMTSGIDTDLAGREHIWPKVLEAFLDNPVGGLGYGTFSAYNQKNFGSSHDAHNTYLSLLAETGIIGFVLFIISFGTIPKNFARLPNKNLKRTYSSIFTILLLSSLTLTLAQFFIFWVFLLTLERTTRNLRPITSSTITTHHNSKIESRLEAIRNQSTPNN